MCRFFNLALNQLAFIMQNSNVMSWQKEEKAISLSNRVGLVIALAVMSVLVVFIFGLIAIFGGSWARGSKEKKHDIHDNTEVTRSTLRR
jgi:hypothetical protein